MISSSDAQWTPPDFNRYGQVQFYTDNITSHNRPNAGWFEHYMVGTKGLCSVYDPPVRVPCNQLSMPVQILSMASLPRSLYSSRRDHPNPIQLTRGLRWREAKFKSNGPRRFPTGAPNTPLAAGHLPSARLLA